MDPLVSLLLWLRRTARELLPAAGAALLAVVVVLDAAQPLGLPAFIAFSVLAAALVATRAWQRTRAVEHRALYDIELGSLLAVVAFAVAVHFDGALDGRFYPLVYVAIALVSAFARPVASLTVVALVVGFEQLLRLLAYPELRLETMAAHLGFALVFALLNILSLRLELARLRRASKRQLRAEQERIQEDARSYRLLRAPRDSGDSAEERDRERGAQRDEERLLRSGLEEIRLSVLFALRLLRESLGIHTTMLLWLDPAGAQLRICELDSDEAELGEGPFASGDGILGAVLSRRAPVCVAGLKPSFVLPYYRGPCPVAAVCAVPVFEHGALRGVLVVDRRKDLPFSEAEQELVEQAARHCARAIDNERVFVQLERTKVEQGKLYRAAEALGAAISEQDVVEAGVSSAREIASVDFAAFTAFDQPSCSHQIRAVSGERSEQLLGTRFDHQAGLVAMAVRNRHPLPYRGEYDPAHHVVFAKGLEPPPMPSLVVLPLAVHDRPLGALVLGSREPGAFGDAARGMLEVLASHMAVSLSNARMVRRLEEQATTDGLTGLLNKRALMENAELKLSAARRFGRRLSVLVTDIDHFKRVNDTYGHDVGDRVIIELGRIHQRAGRATDAVARFGGEEFVIICEETDAEGAMLLADRIRAEFSRTTFHATGQSFHCTCSVGIATYPAGGADWEELFKAADAALYVSKRSGRDRATIWQGARRSVHAA